MESAFLNNHKKLKQKIMENWAFFKLNRVSQNQICFYTFQFNSKIKQL